MCNDSYAKLSRYRAHNAAGMHLRGHPYLYVSPSPTISIPPSNRSIQSSRGVVKNCFRSQDPLTAYPSHRPTNTGLRRLCPTLLCCYWYCCSQCCGRCRSCSVHWQMDSPSGHLYTSPPKLSNLRRCDTVCGRRTRPSTT